MKQLKKLLLINWHYFSFEEIQFEQINFLTGKNAAGKSTLIDAMQLVLLGETNNYFFNKAANEKSDRTLSGYLRGEIGDDGGTGFRVLREGDFNTYVVMEFFDDVREQYFTAGIVFDAYSDGTQKYKYFLYDGPLPTHRFIENELPFTMDQLKKYLNKNYNKKYQWPDTNSSYRLSLLAKFGNVKPSKFFSLFKKAVPFTPITDIETFITEYMCDVQGSIDMSYMRDNLRSYKRLEQDAQMISARITMLETVSTQYSEVMSQKDLILLHRYLMDQAQTAVSQKKWDALAFQLNEINEQIEALKLEMEKESAQLESQRVLRDAKVIERAESDVQKKLDSLEQNLKSLLQERDEWMNSFQRIIKNLNTYGQSWKASFKAFSSLNSTKLNNDLASEQLTSLIKPIEGVADQLQELQVTEPNQLMTLDLNACQSQLETLLELSRQLNYDNQVSITEKQASLKKIKTELEQLNLGNKPYSQKVLALKGILEMELIKVFNKPVEVTILADALEVNDVKWKNAIEGYLFTQKENLIIAPEYFEVALGIYDRVKTENRIFGVGLVDVERIMSHVTEVQQGTLAEEIQSENLYAKAYADYLLGRVQKCENVKQLRQFKIALTPDGMLYKNYVASQMDPERWAKPFIGRRSIEIQIAQLKETQHKLKQATLDCEHFEKCIYPLTRLQTINGNEIEDIFTKLKALPRMAQIAEQMAETECEKSKLDLTYLATLTEQIKDLDHGIKQLEMKDRRAHETLGGLGKAQAILAKESIPQAERKLSNEQRRLTENYSHEWMIQTGYPRFEMEIETKTVDAVYENYERSLKAQETVLGKRREALFESRGRYNQVFHMTHDVTGDDNRDFEMALVELKENKLPQYLLEISDAKAKTHEQFRDEFLAKLKQNFDTVKSQLNELNVALKHRNYGNDQYKYRVEPKPEYRHFYDMITDDLLMIEGNNLSSFAFREKHGDAIDELFKMIIDVEGADNADVRSELEKNIKRFTDYRSYLNFDLIVTDQSGREQRLSKTLLKKSGGETQTPFYISVLASFYHMYRIHQSDQLNNTIRLIIFDEAFSKMDSQRISESLRLLREFKLQAIISAPPDKIPDISPYVDTNLCVMRDQDISFVKVFSKTGGTDLI